MALNAKKKASQACAYLADSTYQCPESSTEFLRNGDPYDDVTVCAPLLVIQKTFTCKIDLDTFSLVGLPFLVQILTGNWLVVLAGINDILELSGSIETAVTAITDAENEDVFPGRAKMFTLSAGSSCYVPVGHVPLFVALSNSYDPEKPAGCESFIVQFGASSADLKALPKGARNEIGALLTKVGDKPSKFIRKSVDNIEAIKGYLT